VSFGCREIFSEKFYRLCIQAPWSPDEERNQKNSVTHMNTTCLKKRYRSLILSISLLTGLTSLPAAVTINQSANFDLLTSLYTYSYSFQNTGTQDLILITIPASQFAGVSSITIPEGFAFTYDPIAQVNSFFEDNSIFTDQTFAAGSTTGPFTFTSPIAPASVPFTAFDVAGTEFTGTTISPVPEPSALMLGGLAVFGIGCRRRRA
jgi:hypothetical protein